MPRLCDLIEEGKSCKLKYFGGVFHYDGVNIRSSSTGAIQTASTPILLDNRWEKLPEETVESVIVAAGFKWYRSSDMLGYDPWDNSIMAPDNTPIPQVKKIIAFAQEMKQCK